MQDKSEENRMNCGDNNLRLYSIRGAVCCENTASSVEEGVGTLCKKIFKENNIDSSNLGQIVNLQFTITPDIDALNPATAFRHADFGFDVSAVPLFCSQEPVIKGMLPRVIRLMLTLYLPEGSSIKASYINGAQALRPDISGGQTS